MPVSKKVRGEVVRQSFPHQHAGTKMSDRAQLFFRNLICYNQVLAGEITLLLKVKTPLEPSKHAKHLPIMLRNIRRNILRNIGEA